MGETVIARLVDKVNEFSDQLKQQAEQLAAKDREIAELRTCIADLRAVCHESAGKILEHRLAAQTAEDDRDAARKRYSELFVAYHEACADEAIAVREHDEARECVGRLYKALAAFEDCAGYAVKGQDLEDAARAEYTAMRAALAATPEHLRNA
jgi:hypothetical protein